MKSAVKIISLITLVTSFSGCSLFGASMTVPDYYETKTVKTVYQAGQTYRLNELRCSKRGDECQWQQYEQAKKQVKPKIFNQLNWKTEKNTYSRPYYLSK